MVRRRADLPQLLTAKLPSPSQPALKEPVTLVVETNEGSRHRTTLFCCVEWRGTHRTPVAGRGREPKELFEQAVARFGFVNPYAEERP